MAKCCSRNARIFVRRKTQRRPRYETAARTRLPMPGGRRDRAPVRPEPPPIRRAVLCGAGRRPWAAAAVKFHQLAGFPCKGEFAADQRVSHHGQAINIGAKIDLQPQRLLRATYTPGFPPGFPAWSGRRRCRKIPTTDRTESAPWQRSPSLWLEAAHVHRHCLAFPDNRGRSPKLTGCT